MLKLSSPAMLFALDQSFAILLLTPRETGNLAQYICSAHLNGRRYEVCLVWAMMWCSIVFYIKFIWNFFFTLNLYGARALLVLEALDFVYVGSSVRTKAMIRWSGVAIGCLILVCLGFSRWATTRPSDPAVLAPPSPKHRAAADDAPWAPMALLSIAAIAHAPSIRAAMS